MTLTLTSPLSPAPTTPSASSLDVVRQRKEARAKDALQALQTLKTQRSSADEEKKAAARKKVDDLKARIRSLRMTMVGNPEAMAKMAAQLARELGAAVKAYAAAGGSPAGMAPPATPAADASAGETSGAEGGEAEAQAVTAEAEAAAGDAEKTSAGDNAAQDASTRNDPYRQVIERQQAQAAEQARQNADKEADDKFAKDVKGLVNELKAILRKAAEEAKRKGESTESPDQKTADKALAEIDDALGDIASPMAGLGFSLQV